MTQKVEGFTPGPWEARGGSVFAGDNRAVALCFGDGEAEWFFNAALVEQAPTLYAENERLRRVMGHVAASLEADGRTADGCTKVDAAVRLRAALDTKQDNNTIEVAFEGKRPSENERLRARVQELEEIATTLHNALDDAGTHPVLCDHARAALSEGGGE